MSVDLEFKKSPEYKASAIYAHRVLLAREIRLCRAIKRAFWADMNKLAGWLNGIHDKLTKGANKDGRT